MATRSLGQLTLDLVARTGSFTGPIDKAGRAAKKSTDKMTADFAALGAGVAASGAAVAAALAAMTVSAVNNANEISRAAALAGTGTEEFQRFAVGAKMVGIEQDKLADIFKDTNDKVGDFLATGGGSLKDFFEQIAPQVGVTAEQFRNLSGPQALQLFSSSLEKANLSQAEMTFYMEGIADEATALLPLLKDNGEGFRELADYAAQAGAIMDQETIRAANELSAASMFMDQAMQGASNQMMSALLPSLSGIAAGFIEATEGGEGFAIAGEAVSLALEAAAATAIGAYSAINLFGEALAGAAFIASAVPDGLDSVKEAARIVGEQLDATAQKSANALDQVFNGPAKGGKVSAVADMLEQNRKAAEGAGIALDKTADSTKALASAEKELEQQRREAEKAVKEALREQERIQENYRSLVASLRTEDEQRLDTMRAQLAVLDAMKGISDSERVGVAGRIAGAATSKAPEFAGLAPEIGGPFGELTKIDEAEEKLAEWYASQLKQIEQFRQERADLTATWDAQEMALKQQHEDALLKIEQARQTAQLASAESIFGDLAGLAATFAGEQSGIYKVMFAAQKAAAIAQSAMAIQQGIAMAAANPFPANLAAMASVAAATAGIVGNIAAIGMAHDGINSVPQTGTWLLEKGERVTTAQTSAKLDKTLSDIQSSRAASSDGRPITINVSQPGVTNAREARESACAVSRRLARAVQGAGRYN